MSERIGLEKAKHGFTGWQGRKVAEEMVLEEGIEPTRPCGHRILSPRILSPKSSVLSALNETKVPLWYQLCQNTIGEWKEKSNPAKGWTRWTTRMSLPNLIKSLIPRASDGNGR